MNRDLVLTSDGSHSLYIKEIDEQYHSKHGAIAEAKKIFIEYGLVFSSNIKNDISIFEVGFGTGLNALLTQIASKELGINVNYDCIEKYPLQIEEINTLNYSAELSISNEILQKLHSLEWEKWMKVDESFSLYKRKLDLLEMKFAARYDLIYFDAFAPEKQEKMWSEEIFKKLYDALNQNGILVTYCVKGEVRRRLKSIGFTLEKLKGPEGGKREVLRAIKF